MHGTPVSHRSPLRRPGGFLRLAISVARYALILSLGVAPLAAQSAADAPGEVGSPGEQELEDFSRPRFMVYFFETEPGTLSESQEFVLYNSILSAVAAANRDVVVVESPDPDVPPTEAGKEELARRINADSWLHVVASGGFENLTLQVETFDILRQRTFGEEIIRPGFRVDYRIIARGFWDSMVETIQGNYSRIVDLTSLRISGEAGSTIEGVPGGPFEIGAEGSTVIEVPYPSAFTLRISSGGYYDVERPIFVGIDPIELEVDQTRLPRLGVDLRLSSLQFPGFRLWYYPIPAELYVRAGVVTQLVGFYLIDNAPQVLVTGGPLSLLSLDVGGYINRPESLTRLYAGLGGYLRVTHAPRLLGLDRSGALGAATATLGVEYSPSRRVRFFAEYQPAWIITDSPQEFIDASFVTNRFPSGRVPGFYVFDRGLIDFRDVFLGLRIDI